MPLSPARALEVLIEVPRGSCLKRDSTGRIAFVSPLPCPYNYGSVPGWLGCEGDLLDALVLGPRLPLWSRVRVHAWGAVGLAEAGLYDDKLICSQQPLTARQRRAVLRFFRGYARCKGVLNFWRGRPGPCRCTGWGSVEAAMKRARPLTPSWEGPRVHF